MGDGEPKAKVGHPMRRRKSTRNSGAPALEDELGAQYLLGPMGKTKLVWR